MNLAPPYIRPGLPSPCNQYTIYPPRHVLVLSRTTTTERGPRSFAARKCSRSRCSNEPVDFRDYESYSVPGGNWRRTSENNLGGWGSPIFHAMDDDAGLDLLSDLGAEVSGADRRHQNGARGSPEARPDLKTGVVRRRMRPHRIILVRHGQSEGNVDETAYTRIPDSKIALTERGWDQAVLCGQKIRKLVESDGDPNWKVYFYVSPYRRTLQTLRGLGLAFERDRIAGVREEPRLREQDFGNFQDREKMHVEKAVRLRYGRFFYRFPDGESAADVYDRVTGFRETLRADIDVGRFQRPSTTACNMNLVLVSHGLTLRVFLMRWYKWTVDQFERLYNFSNTGILVMQLGPGGRYNLTMHHSVEELKAFGLTDSMIADQQWQTNSKPGALNPEWDTSGPDFFDHFDAMERGELDSYYPHGLSNMNEADLKSGGH